MGNFWHKLTSNKPLFYGGAVIALIIAFVILRGAGGLSSTQVVTSGTAQPTDAQVQQQTTLALAGIQANAQANSDAASFALAQLQLQAQVTGATMQADLQHYAIQQDSANQAAQIAAQQQSDATSAQLQASIAKWTLDQATQIQASNNAFQLDYAQAANSTTLGLANIQAGVVNHQIDSNADVTIASLSSQAAQLASYLGAQVSINDSNNSKDVAQAQIQAQTARHQSDNGLVGGILGGILGIFSDERLKTDVVLLGREADGLGVYSYRYRDAVAHTIGYLASEIRKLRPWALGTEVAGFATVRYELA